MITKRKVNKKFLLEIECFYDADVYLYNGKVNNEGYSKTKNEISTLKSAREKNALLVLRTCGGDVESAFKIAREFQENYSELYVFILGKCKNAGTLLTLGAHKVIMNDLSELAPLNATFNSMDLKGGVHEFMLLEIIFEIAVNQFMLTLEELIYRFREFDISLEDAEKLASIFTLNVMKPIICNLNFENFYESYKNFQIVEEYANQLIWFAKNSESEAVSRLLFHYPSTGFVIDKTEAEEVFKSVEAPLTELTDLIYGSLSIITDGYQRKPKVMALSSSKKDNLNINSNKIRRGIMRRDTKKPNEKNLEWMKYADKIAQNMREAILDEEFETSRTRGSTKMFRDQSW